MMSAKLYRSSRRAADLHINVYRDLFGIVIPLIPLYVLLLPSNENDHPIAITRNRCRHCCSYKLRMYTRICDYDYAIPVHFHHDRLSSCTLYQPGPAIHTANSLRRFFFLFKSNNFTTERLCVGILYTYRNNGRPDLCSVRACFLGQYRYIHICIIFLLYKVVHVI